MKNFNGVSIIDLIEMDPTDHDTEVYDIIKKTTDYDKHNKVIKDVLDYLKDSNRENWSALDDAASAIEAIVKDVAFEQGFKTAIKLIFSSLN